VNFTFDPAKDKKNRRKHGISLSRANEFDFNGAVIFPDDSQDYGEPRDVAVGFLAGNLYVLIYVPLDEASMQVISLRRASAAEEIEYAEY
jgi:uncharacterized DUF497 family protein